MKKLLIASAFVFVASTSIASANNGVDCSSLIGSPKNHGQLNQVIKELGIFSGQNTAQDAKLFGVPVDEWIHTQVLSLCGVGRDAP